MTTLNVEYNGDDDYNSLQANLPITVSSSGSIKPTLTMVPPTTTANFPFSTTVTISGPSGNPVPTGTVTLSSPGFLYPATQPLTNGSAVLTISCCLIGGQDTLTATYLGDDNYTAGTASANVNVISQTNILFPTFPPPISVNQSLSVTVTVESGFTNLTTPPTGTITFSSGSYSSSPVQLSAGSASITIPGNSLSVGTDTLTANYSGDTNYESSTNFEYVTISAGPPGLILAGTAVTLAPGATTGNTSTITATPSNGFTGSVALTAAITASPTGAQDPPTLSFGATTPVSITGTSAGSATLTITTTPATASSLVYPRGSTTPWYLVGGSTLACILLFWAPTRGRNWRITLGMGMLFAALAGGLFACGGGSGGGGGGGGGGTSNLGTTAGTYTITLTGTSGSTTETGTVTLTVQ
jgi:hypothetical protein